MGPGPFRFNNIETERMEMETFFEGYCRSLSPQMCYMLLYL